MTSTEKPKRSGGGDTKSVASASAKKVHNYADTKKGIRNKAPARVQKFEVAKLCKEASEESTSDTNEHELFQEEILVKHKD